MKESTWDRLKGFGIGLSYLGVISSLVADLIFICLNYLLVFTIFLIIEPKRRK